MIRQASDVKFSSKTRIWHIKCYCAAIFPHVESIFVTEFYIVTKQSARSPKKTDK